MSSTYEVFLAAAMAFVFTQGTLFKTVRDHGPKIWREFSTCALCVGVWVGGGLHALFASFPQGADKLGIARYAAELLGIGSLTGVLALLAVSIWDWLGKEPGIRVDGGATLMYLTKPTVALNPADTMLPPAFPSEPPTEPTAAPEATSNDGMTRRIPADQLRAKKDESRRSKP